MSAQPKVKLPQYAAPRLRKSYPNKVSRTRTKRLTVANLLANTAKLANDDLEIARMIRNLTNGNVGNVVSIARSIGAVNTNPCALAKRIIDLVLKCEDAKESALSLIQGMILQVLNYCAMKLDGGASDEIVVAGGELAICLVEQACIKMMAHPNKSIAVQADLICDIFTLGDLSVLHGVNTGTKSIILCCLLVWFNIIGEFRPILLDWIFLLDEDAPVALEDAIGFVTLEDDVASELGDYILSAIRTSSMRQDVQDGIAAHFTR